VFTIVVPRDDVTPEEVAKALRDGLGPRYNVVPGLRMSRNPLGNPRPAHLETILVGTGSNRLVRAQVTVSQGAGKSRIRIDPGGVSSELVLNALGIARKIRRVLADAPSLR
jgi:hypothetical protein